MGYKASDNRMASSDHIPPHSVGFILAGLFTVL